MACYRNDTSASGTHLLKKAPKNLLLVEDIRIKKGEQEYFHKYGNPGWE